jgi:hypothetical protein
MAMNEVITAKPARGRMMGNRTRKKTRGNGLIHRLDILDWSLMTLT